MVDTSRVPIFSSLKKKIRLLSTAKKDEAAFYLNELARGLLKDRVSIRLGDTSVLLDTFEAIHLRMEASEKNAEYAVSIRLVWRKPSTGVTFGLPRGPLGPEAAKEGT